MIIFLVGLPGSGKTTAGQKLAAFYNYTFKDLDDEIILKTGKTIPSIFEEEGEQGFRKHEREALHNTIKNSQNLILATGGGTPCFFDNMEYMNQHGKALYIKVSWTTLAGRMQLQETEKRPLMAGMDHHNLIEELKTKFAHRLPFYEKAQYHIEEYQTEPEDIDRMIRN